MRFQQHLPGGSSKPCAKVFNYLAARQAHGRPIQRRIGQMLRVPGSRVREQRDQVSPVMFELKGCPFAIRSEPFQKRFERY